MRSRFFTLAAAVASLAAELADAEDRVAAVMAHSAALHPHRKVDLLALAARARRHADENRAVHARWHRMASVRPDDSP